MKRYLKITRDFIWSQDGLTKYEADKCLRPRTCVIRAGIKDLTLSCYTDGCGGVFRPVY